MTVQAAQRLFTVTEYYLMAEAGILSEDDRVELIEGKIMNMSPIGSRHAACVKRLNTLFSRQVGQAALVSVQDPIRLDDYSEPEPDLALLRPRDDFYAQGHPTPADVLLIVEVADTSEEYDREVKILLYARAGIPEVWLVSLPRDLFEIYRRPTPNGYQDVRQARRGEIVVAQSIPGLTMAVDAILG
ncbi:MAG: Uma2 family endonuclease [Candidatus Tectomicrobia bacterium]|nr:Uma2 family endonuclease [Candidatus Tectomicrobia bacterium]